MIAQTTSLQRRHRTVELHGETQKERSGQLFPDPQTRQVKKTHDLGTGNMFQLSLNQVSARLKSAHNKYTRMKANANMWSADYFDIVAKSIADKEGTSPEMNKRNCTPLLGKYDWG